MYEGGLYTLKARIMPEPIQEPIPEKTSKKTAKKTEKTAEETPAKKTTRKKKEEAVAEEVKEEKTVKKATKKAAKTEKKAEPLPPAPLQPIEPIAPVTPEVAPAVIPEEKTAPKKRAKKTKAVEEKPIVEEVKQPESQPEIKEEPAPIKTEEKTDLVVKEKAEIAKKNVVMDMSFLFGDKKPAKQQEEKKPEPKAEKQPETKQEQKAETKEEQAKANTDAKPAPQKDPAPQKTAVQKPANVRKLSDKNVRNVRKAETRPLTADEKLREAFLKRIRTLGGDYFEYYSVYLLERYSMKNGRRLEGLKINGGDRDGGIDGEIELTDKLGFKETIYIQSKNWNPEKGDEKLWVVGETLLQQFIGACACRQAKDGKQHCRGIFITTSRFTPEAKRILDTMSDKIVGYDGNDLYEAAKECAFGLIEKNGVWSLDEKLLSGSKAFFHLY